MAQDTRKIRIRKMAQDTHKMELEKWYKTPIRWNYNNGTGHP